MWSCVSCLLMTSEGKHRQAWSTKTLQNISLQALLYLVLVGHPASSPHLFHHKVPELSLRLQVCFKHLRPARGADAKGRDTNKKKGCGCNLHFLHRDGRVIYWNKSVGLWWRCKSQTLFKEKRIKDTWPVSLWTLWFPHIPVVPQSAGTDVSASLQFYRRLGRSWHTMTACRRTRCCQDSLWPQRASWHLVPRPRSPSRRYKRLWRVQSPPGLSRLQQRERDWDATRCKQTEIHTLYRQKYLLTCLDSYVNLSDIPFLIDRI